jgi:glycosyltransferase involved in cell wall biosynthesis
LRRALIVAWYFPPVGGPGTQRTSKYCKYLPSNDWSPVVIAGVDPAEHQDETLLADIATGVEVHRLPMPSTIWQRLRRWLFDHRLGRLGSWLGYWKDFPDIRRDWAVSVVDLACELHGKEPFDLVYTTSYPYSAHWAGEKIKQKLNLPWVADLRDPWSENEIMLGWLPSWMRGRHAGAERKMAHTAEALTFAHPQTARQFQDKYGCAPDRCIGITNGYDPDDYANFKPMPPVENGIVKMVHTGSFYGDYAPDALRVALEQYWAKDQELPNQLLIRFVGGSGDSVFLDLPGLKVEVLPRVSQEEALREQEEAHMLLNVFDRRTGVSNVSGKLFGYLASGRPVFGVLPTEGSMAGIIRECEAGWVVDCDDPQSIVRQLRTAMRQIGDNRGSPFRKNKSTSKYSRPVLTRRLAQVFEAACEQWSASCGLRIHGQRNSERVKD